MSILMTANSGFFLNSLYWITAEVKMEGEKKRKGQKILQFGQRPHWESHTCLQEQNSAIPSRLLPLQL